MSVEIKICGLSTPEAVEACVSAHVDFLGFIFFPKSPRNVLPEQASELRKIMGKSAKAVAVTVDADDNESKCEIIRINRFYSGTAPSCSHGLLNG